MKDKHKIRRVTLFREFIKTIEASVHLVFSLPFILKSKFHFVFQTNWRLAIDWTKDGGLSAGLVSSDRNLLAADVFLSNSALGAWPSCFVTIAGETVSRSLRVAFLKTWRLGNRMSYLVLNRNLEGSSQTCQNWHFDTFCTSKDETGSFVETQEFATSCKNWRCLRNYKGVMAKWVTFVGFLQKPRPNGSKCCGTLEILHPTLPGSRNPMENMLRRPQKCEILAKYARFHEVLS